VLLPWGSDAERARSERLSQAIAGSEVLARQPLDQTAKIISGASLVVGVDTGLLHLAAAYAVPLVGIYVATEPGRTGPVGAGRIEVVGGKGAAVTADEVIAAAESMLR
jgi:heptosyltransferase-1